MTDYSAMVGDKWYTFSRVPNGPISCYDEIIEVLGGDEKSYDTAARRLRRRAKALFPEGGA